jgi:hypothetical protein
MEDVLLGKLQSDFAFEFSSVLTSRFTHFLSDRLWVAETSYGFLDIISKKNIL